MQLKKSWSYEKGIFQAMAAKRMMLLSLHELYAKKDPKISFAGFKIPKTVWTNQLKIIPCFMKAMVTLMGWLGAFITIERCGEIMAPLFIESKESSLEKSGKLYTWTKAGFLEKQEDEKVLNRASRERLWKISMELCQSRSPA